VARRRAPGGARRRARLDADVIVVGAGPGGSSAAFHLARLGRKVLLLDRQAFPRDKSCGDALTRSAVQILAEMGVLPALATARRTHGLRIFMKGRGSRSFEYPRDLDDPYGLVLPRRELDHILCRHAVEAGATLWERTLADRLIHADGAVAGVEVVRDGRRTRLHSRIVIAADGAASRLAQQAGLVGGPVQGFGSAIRGYYDAVEGLTETLQIYAPLDNPASLHLLPSYGWVFPLGGSSANVGVGVFQRTPGVNLRRMFERFLDALRKDDPRFARMKECGEWKGAPLRFDFAPERSGVRGLLLVGDAAGMISPFTGEGIGFALDSGRLAAQAAELSLSSALDGCERAYASSLARRYAGYFETGRQSARRYLLVWQVLADTFHNDKPLFSLCRQAALLPEGIADSLASTLPDVGALPVPAAVRSDGLAVDEILIDTIRRDWPFLARLAMREGVATGVSLRPALLTLLAASSARRAKFGVLATAAALELGCLAVLSHVSVMAEAAPSTRNPQANWGNLFAIMVGDYLMSHAYDLSAQVGAGVSLAIADALAKACEGWVRDDRGAHDLEMTEQAYLETLSRKASLMFELPCRLGAELAGSPAFRVDALSGYGLNVGIAYLLADEVQAIRSRSTLLSRLAPELREGHYSLPVLRAARSDEGRLRSLLDRGALSEQDAQAAERLVAESAALAAVLDIARHYVARAKGKIAPLPDGPVRRSLDALADFAVERQRIVQPAATATPAPPTTASPRRRSGGAAARTRR
jgi:menaquinone-9 beta-reductase